MSADAGRVTGRYTPGQAIDYTSFAASGYTMGVGGQVRPGKRADANLPELQRAGAARPGAGRRVAPVRPLPGVRPVPRP